MAPPREVMYYLEFFGIRRFSGTNFFWKKLFFMGKFFFSGKKIIEKKELATDLRSMMGGVVRRMVLRRMVL